MKESSLKESRGIGVGIGVGIGTGVGIEALEDVSLLILHHTLEPHNHAVHPHIHLSPGVRPSTTTTPFPFLVVRVRVRVSNYQGPRECGSPCPY